MLLLALLALIYSERREVSGVLKGAVPRYVSAQGLELDPLPPKSILKFLLGSN
jgi:hypothetical protein